MYSSQLLVSAALVLAILCSASPLNLSKQALLRRPGVRWPPRRGGLIAGNSGFYHCADLPDELLEVDKVELFPMPLRRNQEGMLLITGTLKEDLGVDNVLLSSISEEPTTAGPPSFEERFCWALGVRQGFGETCPPVKGKVQLYLHGKIYDDVPQVNFTVTFEAYDKGTGKNVFCIAGQVEVAK